MKAVVVLLALAVLPAANATERLTADSLVCETEGLLGELRRAELKDQPGSVVFERMQAQAKLGGLMAEYHQVMGDLAVREERIRANANMVGSTQASQASAESGLADARQTSTSAQSFLERCMVVERGEAVTVVERRPISGAVKVGMQIHGAPAEVWTTAYYLEGAALPTSATPAPPTIATATTAAPRQRVAGARVPLPEIDIDAECAKMRQLSGSAVLHAHCLEQEPITRQWLEQRTTSDRIAEYCGRMAQTSRSHTLTKACVEQEEAAEQKLSSSN